MSVLAAMRGSLAVRRTYAAQVVADVPMGYWPLLGGVSSEADAGGSQGAAMAVSTGTTTVSKILVPTAGGIVLAGSGPNLEASSSGWMQNIRAAEMWIQTSSTTDMALFSRRNTTEHWAIYHNNTNGLRLLLFNGTTNTVVDPGIWLNDGYVHHVLITWTTSTCQFYIDGVLTYSGGIGGTWSQSGGTDPLTLASEYTNSRRWSGKMGHAAVYDSSYPSAGRVAAHFNAGRDPALTMFDTFAKVAGSSSLGTPPIGGSWSVHGSGIWGIASPGVAYLSSATNGLVSQATMDVGSSDMEVEWVMQTHDRGFADLAFRTDATGMGLFIADGSTAAMNMFKQTDALTNAQVATLGNIGPIVAGDVMKVKAIGDVICFYRNGALLTTSLVTDNKLNTRAGMQQYVSSGHLNIARWNSVVAKKAEHTAHDALVLNQLPSAFWKLDETTGTNVADWSGVGPNLGAAGAAVTLGGATTTKGDSAAVFAGTASTGQVTVGDFAGASSHVGGSGTWSWTGWIYPTTFTGANRCILWKSTNSLFEFGVYCSSAGVLNMNMAQSGGTNVVAITGPTITLNAWTHLALTYNRAASEFKLYVNGSLYATATSFSGNTSDTASSLYIGGRGDTTGDRFIGRMSRFALYPSVLNSSAIVSMYQAGI